MSAMTRLVGRVARAAILTACWTLAAACSPGESASDDVASDSSRAADVQPVDSTVVTVYKSPTCGCCTAWADHLRKEGFRVVAIDTSDLEPIKRRHDVPHALGSCHTAVVGDYVIEGHVPVADIRRLLAERPAIRGLAVPGMPQGSPGMETGVKDSYQVVSFTRDGKTAVFAHH